MAIVLTPPSRLGCILAVLLSIGILSACQRAAYFLPTTRVAAARLAIPEEATARIEPLREVPHSFALVPRAYRLTPLHSSRRRGRHAAADNVSKLPAIDKISPAVRVSEQVTGRASIPATGAELPPIQRSRGIAILLAALSLGYLPLSLHNFYLGYYGRGAAAISLLIFGSYLLIAGVAGFFVASSNLAFFGYMGILVLVGWFTWQLSDLCRIINGDLQPKNGQYRRKKAQP